MFVDGEVEADAREKHGADFKEVKHRFDPDNVLNPGKIVDPPRMDDRSLFRYPPGYRIDELKTVLDWSAYPGAGGGFPVPTAGHRDGSGSPGVVRRSAKRGHYPVV